MEVLNENSLVENLSSLTYLLRMKLLVEHISTIGELLQKDALYYLFSMSSSIVLSDTISLLTFLNENNVHWQGEEAIELRYKDLNNREIAMLVNAIDKHIQNLKWLKLKRNASSEQCEEIKTEIETLWQQVMELKGKNEEKHLLLQKVE